MKKLTAIFAFIILIACNRPLTETRLKGSMEGIYELRAISYQGPGTDTGFIAKDQVKIYTDKFYMYGTTRPDSSAFFGFGSYLFNDTLLTEQSIFNSYALDSTSDILLKINRSDSGYKQTLSGVKMQGSLYDVGETYRALQEYGDSELDGVWEQVSFINITGTDTTRIRNKQFKIYQQGYFMWIHYYPIGTTSSYKKGFGFGRFTIRNNAVTETISASNYPEIIDAPITLNYKLNGNNELLLTFSDGNSVTTETYKRRD